MPFVNRKVFKCFSHIKKIYKRNFSLSSRIRAVMCSHSKFMKEMLIIFKEKQSRSFFVSVLLNASSKKKKKIKKNEKNTKKNGIIAIQWEKQDFFHLKTIYTISERDGKFDFIIHSKIMTFWFSLNLLEWISETFHIELGLRKFSVFA